MDFLQRLQRFSRKELRTLAGLCGGAALLVFVALTLSGNLPGLPHYLKIALQKFALEQAVAAVPYWQTQYSNDGTYLNNASCVVPSGAQCNNVSPCGNVGVAGFDASWGTQNAAAYAYLSGASGHTGLTVISGNTVTLDWSCRPSYAQENDYSSCSWFQCGCYNGGVSTQPLSSNATITDGSGTVIQNTSQLAGSMTTVVTGALGAVKNYTLNCSGRTTYIPITISSANMSITATPKSVDVGSTSVLNWTAGTANSCTITATPSNQVVYSQSVAGDSSGNHNDWSSNGVNTNTDQTWDSPTKGFALGNLLQPLSGAFSAGLLSNSSLQRSTVLMSSGKWYWEVTANAAGVVAGAISTAGTASTVSVANGVTAGFRFDAGTGLLEYTTDGSTYATVASGLTGGRFAYATGGSNSYNFGQGGQASLTYDSAADGYFKYAPTATYKAVQTANLATPAVAQPNNYFTSIAYAGAICGNLKVSSFSGGVVKAYLTSTSGFCVRIPSDWKSTNNTVEVIGGGGGGTSYGCNGGGGGGGGYAKKINLALTGGQVVLYGIGTGGGGTTAGGSTYFNGSSCGGSSVCATGGSPGNGAAGGGGGWYAVGSAGYSGGAGGNASNCNIGSGGGGGAAGKNGAGGAGAGAFTNAAGYSGGAGGAGDAGSGGAGGAAGTYYPYCSGTYCIQGAGNGGNGAEWASGIGSGGGGGGSGYGSNSGGQGGGFGGGGGGGGPSSTPGSGYQGVIVITYTP